MWDRLLTRLGGSDAEFLCTDSSGFFNKKTPQRNKPSVLSHTGFFWRDVVDYRVLHHSI
jgi:hypothetical protein